MDKKGQIMGAGAFIVLFVLLIVGLVLFQVVAQEAGSSTSLGSFVNTTYTAGAAGTSITITDYKLISGVTISNSTSGDTIPTSNYTINNNQVVNGALAVTVDVLEGPYESVDWDISSTEAQPLTYIADSGARSVTNLIAVFFAIALLVVAIEPTSRSKFLEMIGK